MLAVTFKMAFGSDTLKMIDFRLLLIGAGGFVFCFFLNMYQAKSILFRKHLTKVQANYTIVSEALPLTTPYSRRR